MRAPGGRRFTLSIVPRLSYDAGAMSVLHSIRATLVPIRKEGAPFIAAALVVAVAGLFLWQPLFWLALIVAGWCAYFFRDPPRVVPIEPDLVVSPADGRVSAVVLGIPPAELGLGERDAPPHLGVHERLRLPREPRAGGGTGDADRLPAGQVHQCRARQGERGQRAERHRPRQRPRPGRRGADRRPRRAPHRLLRQGGRRAGDRRADRPDPLRLAPRCLAAGVGAACSSPRGRRRSPARPCSPASAAATRCAASASTEGPEPDVDLPALRSRRRAAAPAAPRS